MKLKIKKKQRNMIISIVIGMVLVVAGYLTGDSGIFGNLMLIAVFVIVVPIFLYKYSEYAWIKSVENQFPNLIRDLADSKRSGMSFNQSIKIATKANYGKLSPEVHTMHNKLSWGIPFLRVIDMFGDRVKKSKLIRESLNIIKESYEAGGDVSATLDAIASDMVMLKETEAERVSIVKQHVLIMYGVFFMFLGISIMIIYVMVPMIGTQPAVSTGGFGFSFTNPCEGVGFFPCNIFSLIGIMFEITPGSISEYYISIFFLVVVIQGFFTGLIAGQLGEDSVVAGSKHALIMVFAGVGVFLFVAKMGLLPI
jgi:flagellar protein FlaJ